MAYVDLITPLHTATKRDYLARVTGTDKAMVAEIACRFGADYWDGDRANGYGGYRYDGRWRPVAERIVKLYKLRSGSRVLDVGCGKGFLLFELAQLVSGLEIAGVDISSYALAHSKAEVKPYLKEGNAASLPFADRSFDFVYSINTLHNLHLNDLWASIGEIARVGKGPAHITVEAYRTEREKVNLMYWQLTCRAFMTPGEWEWLFNKVGYTGDHGYIFFEWADPVEGASIESRFLADGYVVAPAEDRAALDSLRDATAGAAAAILGIAAPNDIGHFLDHIHEHVSVSQLNDFRLAVLARLLNDGNFRPAYFACGRRLVQAIAGTELAMQRNIGLSIQMPNDDSSLLPLHSDTWGSECSPYEVVLWIPLVDCMRTKTMFLLPPKADKRWRGELSRFEEQGTEALYRAVEPELSWTTVRYGEVMIFTPTVMHGNRVNREPTTRWSFNIRFKGLFTPYANKKLGDYFMPLTMTPASRIGLDFEMPNVT